VIVLLQNPDSNSEISLKIGQYLMELRHMKLYRRTKSVPVFGPPCIRFQFLWKFLGRLFLNDFVEILHISIRFTSALTGIASSVAYQIKIIKGITL